MKKYVTGIRFLKAYDIEEPKETSRVDVLLLRVLKEGPQDIETTPELQFHFGFDPEGVTPKQIAHHLRSLAYKIGKMSDE